MCKQKSQKEPNQDSEVDAKWFGFEPLTALPFFEEKGEQQ